MEEDPKDDLEEEDEEEDQDGNESEPEFYSPPQVVRNPAPRRNFQGPTPRWAVDLKRWRQE